MEMRECRREDLPEVKRIANAAWSGISRMTREALGDEIADLIHPAGDHLYKGEQVQRQLESGECRLWICVDGERIVGFVSFIIDGDQAEICNNAALPDSGLKGIGQFMYRAVLRYLKSQDVKLVTVQTGLDHAHAPARRAYERAGFSRHLDSVTYYLTLKDYQ